MNKRVLAAALVGTPLAPFAVAPLAAASIERRAYDIPAQDLARALETFGRQSGMAVLFDPAQLAGVRSRTLRGRLSADDALAALLGGSGLSARNANPHTYVIDLQRPQPQPPRRDEMRRTPDPGQETPFIPAPSLIDQAIVVTGSRLEMTSFNSPTPVNAIDQARVQNLSFTNVFDALNQLPAFRPLNTPATSSFRASQNIAARNLDLRGLGPTRTLTLVDGRRRVPTSDDGTFDLNSIPSILVRRAEVVTGGASAAYGADAVAGVVNLLLTTRLDGLKSEASYGISQRGDARNVYAALAAGTDFAGDRGHLVIGGEYSREGGVGDFNMRSWSRRYHNFIPNPFFSTNPSESNGLPATVATDNVLYVLNSAGLVSIAHPLQGMQFDAQGNLIPFAFGDLFNRARPSVLMVGGDASVRDIYGFNNTPLVVPISHGSVLAHAEIDLAPSLTMTTELSFARVVGGPSSGATRFDQNGAIRITRDNAFLTPATAAAMDAANVSFIPVSRSNAELGTSFNISRNTTWRGLVSLSGGIDGNWKWDASYEYGRATGKLTSRNQRVTSRWLQALDAVFAPVGSGAEGTIVCRSSIDDPTNGCIPANVMGPGRISAAAAAWVNASTFQTRRFAQTNIGANVRGSLFEGWAGDIAIAAGAEYRANSSEGDADPLSKAEAFSSVTASLLPKIVQKVTEGYLEARVPLFSNVPAGSLQADGAIRRTHYSLSGNATTWKIGAVYEPDESVLIRFTNSRDIRAPSAFELNPNTRTQRLSFSDPKYNIQYPIQSTSGGNPDLTLERARTLTLGAVIKPAWLRGFRLAIDYYDIRVRGAIDLITPTLAVALCRAGSLPGVCAIGTDPATGAPDRILRLFATYQNVNRLKAEGVEAVADYALDLAGGRLNVTLNANYAGTLSTALPDGTVREFAGVTGNATSVGTLFGVPRWRADLVATYERRKGSVTAQASYIPAGILSRDYVGPDDPDYSVYLPNSISDNRVAGRIYFNLHARLKLLDQGAHTVELFGGIYNLFDKDPPANLRLSGNPVYFDPVGRSFRGGVRASW